MVDKKHALLLSFLKPATYRILAARTKMIRDSNMRIGAGKDLTTKFKAYLQTTAKI